MYVFKDDRVIEFDGLLSANTLTEFLLDVSNLRADSQLLSLINTGLSNVTNLLYCSISSFSLSLAAGGACGGDWKCSGVESF